MCRISSSWLPAGTSVSRKFPRWFVTVDRPEDRNVTVAEGTASPELASTTRPANVPS